MTTRRSFVRGSAAMFAGAFIAPKMDLRSPQFQEIPVSEDPRLKQLIGIAVDAAMSSGASYADARLTFTQQLTMEIRGTDTWPTRMEKMGFGVRAVYDGYWGFASSPVWGPIEAARLGKSAVANARANVLGKPREMTLVPNPTSISGDWVMPVQDDPFEMASEEIYDYLNGLHTYIDGLRFIRTLTLKSNFVRQQKAFGNSEGQFLTQRLYNTGGDVSLGIEEVNVGAAGGQVKQISMAGMGFEYFRNQPMRTYIDQVHEEALQDRLLPYEPVDVGRFPVMIDETGIAHIVSQSIGVATEVDRVMGYEANEGGTSYVIDPEDMLGTLKIGAPSLHVSASRSSPGALMHVKWDDEGIQPKDFQIVKDGILANLQTHREGCGWITSHYTKTGQPIASFGCAYAPDAVDSPLVYSADLTLHPAAGASGGVNVLRQDIENGVEWKMPNISLDFQQMTGLVRGTAYQIKRGKRVARFAGAGMLFRTFELWNNIQRLGGPDSPLRVGCQVWKGEPLQTGAHSVDAPPVVFKEMTIIDVTRKA